MAKETMERVNEAEAEAQKILQQAEGESKALLASAEEQGKKLVTDSVKEAHKRADVLCGVARADAGKISTEASKRTDAAFEALQEAALSHRAQASQKIVRIVLEAD